MSDRQRRQHPILDGKPLLLGERFVARVDHDHGTSDIEFGLVGIIHTDVGGRDDFALLGDDGEEYYLTVEHVQRLEARASTRGI